MRCRWRKTPFAFLRRHIKRSKRPNRQSGERLSVITSSLAFDWVSFAFPVLVPIITPALEHSAAKEGGTPALSLWDSVSTGVKMPSPPWTTGHYLARGEVAGFNDGRIHTSFDMGSGFLICWMSTEMLEFLDPRCSGSPAVGERGAITDNFALVDAATRLPISTQRQSGHPKEACCWEAGRVGEINYRLSMPWSRPELCE